MLTRTARGVLAPLVPHRPVAQEFASLAPRMRCQTLIRASGEDQEDEIDYGARVFLVVYVKYAGPLHPSKR